MPVVKRTQLRVHKQAAPPQQAPAVQPPPPQQQAADVSALCTAVTQLTQQVAALCAVVAQPREPVHVHLPDIRPEVRVNVPEVKLAVAMPPVTPQVHVSLPEIVVKQEPMQVTLDVQLPAQKPVRRHVDFTRAASGALTGATLVEVFTDEEGDNGKLSLQH